ncbi:PQQ-dependent catabolism-associated CXXCW motif protein [uncultured Jannaschia sp.]|uniref:PQQ-dependent catabolism-associated CXXCW motif protein n=1 Tax=uncultured Jannaschia sp. TaxID=293347 RepID=UPI0026078C10|nr:PQQ-dependent catabolism-associated CXXCW motif protein [uncultured Jannaschia sp.]
MRRVGIALALLWPFAALAVPEPAGYRTEAYRAPVPETLAGARVLSPEAAHAIWRAGGAVFVDVLPRPPKPEGLPDGTIWREPPRRSIPGATWMPNVGYGALAPLNDAYFRDGLTAATGGDMDRALVFFCLAECWMSWNAAKRAMEYGYVDVMWFPEGTDGWAFYDYPTEVLEPRPGGR